MKLIENLSLKLATAIKNANPNNIKTSIEVMQFALISLIGHLITFSISLSISALLGTLFESIAVIIAFMTLRWFSGGFHFRSPELCAIVGIVGVIIIPFINVSSEISLVMMIISMILILIFAPNGENYSRIFDIKHKPLLKTVSLILVSSNFLWSKDYLTISFFLQSISFIPLLLKGGETK